jgi:hypothetical protein
VAPLCCSAMKPVSVRIRPYIKPGRVGGINRLSLPLGNETPKKSLEQSICTAPDFTMGMATCSKAEATPPSSTAWHNVIADRRCSSFRTTPPTIGPRRYVSGYRATAIAFIFVPCPSTVPNSTPSSRFGIMSDSGQRTIGIMRRSENLSPV